MSSEPLRVIEGGRASDGWDALWVKDVWCQDELPHGDLASKYRGAVRISFDGIEQPWLKETAKRWARLRLLGDTTPPHDLQLHERPAPLQRLARRPCARGDLPCDALARGA